MTFQEIINLRKIDLIENSNSTNCRYIETVIKYNLEVFILKYDKKYDVFTLSNRTPDFNKFVKMQHN
jgi:hypothetical protein